MNTKNINTSYLVRYLLANKEENALEQSLKALLTPTELDAICTRLEIVRLLKQGLTQREIAKQLGVGVATVTRGSRALQAGKF